MQLSDGTFADRVPAWISRVIQPEHSPIYEGIYHSPPTKYTFKHPRPSTPKALRIYECHVGIASTEPRVASYTHFTECILPRIAAQGYNCIQLMAIMEHVYYGCFGYQVKKHRIYIYSGKMNDVNFFY